MTEKALAAFGDSEQWDHTGWLPGMRRALEAAWPEPTFTRMEVRDALAAIERFQDQHGRHGTGDVGIVPAQVGGHAR